MFLIVLTYVKPLEEIDRLLDDHLAYIDRNYAEGRFLLSGAREPRVGGVILSKGDNVEEIETVVATDPFIAEGAATYELLPFKAGRRVKELDPLLDN